MDSPYSLHAVGRHRDMEEGDGMLDHVAGVGDLHVTVTDLGEHETISHMLMQSAADCESQ